MRTSSSTARVNSSPSVCFIKARYRQAGNISGQCKLNGVNDAALAGAIGPADAEVFLVERKRQIPDSVKLDDFDGFNADHFAGSPGVTIALRKLSGSSFCCSSASFSAAMAGASRVFSASSFFKNSAKTEDTVEDRGGGGVAMNTHQPGVDNLRKQARVPL